MIELKLRKIGNSIGVILPQEALTALRVGQDDILYLTAAPDGFRITPYDPGFERQMEVARRIMKKDRNLLRELAKR
jgi:putative addiction module antidote